MDEHAVREAIRTMFEGVEVLEAAGDAFFFFTPQDGRPPDHRLPFATLVSSDAHDPASRLDRPGVYRLNLGAKPESYRALFGPPPKPAPDWGVIDSGHDYGALDTLMPHPVYAPLSWVCVLNPREATFQQLRPLLAEAYALAVRRRRDR